MKKNCKLMSVYSLARRLVAVSSHEAIHGVE